MYGTDLARHTVAWMILSRYQTRSLEWYKKNREGATLLALQRCIICLMKITFWLNTTSLDHIDIFYNVKRILNILQDAQWSACLPRIDNWKASCHCLQSGNILFNAGCIAPSDRCIHDTSQLHKRRFSIVMSKQWNNAVETIHSGQPYLDSQECLPSYRALSLISRLSMDATKKTLQESSTKS